jgi:2-dehydropantoate 2-reductase
MSKSLPDFEFAVLGAGALGSILGAHLARAGHSVAMLARGRRADHIRVAGLQITGLAEIITPVTVITDPAQLRSAGTLIVAMKTPGTDAALERLRHVDLDVALSIQNGPIKNDLLAQVFGETRVLGALANTSGELRSTGEVLFTRNVNILLGELGGDLTTRAQQVARTIDDAGVRATAVTNIRSLEWSKFAAWVGMMVLSVTTRTATWRYLSDPGSARVLVRLVREIGALMQALKIGLTDESVLPVATFCRTSEDEAVATLVKVGLEFEKNAPGHRMSSLQDFEAGRALEIDETLGYALREAVHLGVAMPQVDSFYQLVAALDRLRANPQHPA